MYASLYANVVVFSKSVPSRVDWLGRVNISNHPRRVSHRHALRRDTLGDDAAGANHRAAPDGHAGEDGGVAADPAVLLDGDGLAALGPARAVAHAVVERVRARVEGDAGADHGAVAEADCAGVDPGAVAVDVYVFTQSEGGV